MVALPKTDFFVLIKWCRDCREPLTEDDVSRCRKCKDKKNRAAKKRRRKDPEYQRRHNRNYARKVRKSPEYRKRVSEWRKQRSVDGKCRQCSEDSMPDSDYCQKHEDAKKQDQRNYRTKKKLEKLLVRQ